MRDNNESNSDNIHEKHKRNDIRGDVANYSRSHKASDSLDHIENHCHSPPTSSDKMIHNEAQKAEKKTTANLRQEEAHCSGDKDDTTANMRVVHFIPSHYYEYKLTKNCSTTSTTSAAPPPESASFQQQTCDGVMQALDALFSFTCPELGLTHSAVWLVARDYFGVLPVLPNGNDILTLEAALPTPTAMLGTLLHVLLCHRLELPLDARTWEVCSNGTDTAYNVNIKDTINADDSNDTSVPPRVSSSMLEGALAAAAQELLLTFTHIHQKWHLNCLRFRRYYREMHTQVATFISSIDDECAFDWTHIVCQDMLVGAIAGDAVTTRFPPLKDEIGRFWKAVSMAVEQRDHQVRAYTSQA